MAKMIFFIDMAFIKRAEILLPEITMENFSNCGYVPFLNSQKRHTQSLKTLYYRTERI